MVEMNQQVLTNLERMIGEVENSEQEGAAHAAADNSHFVIAAARRRAAATHQRAVSTHYDVWTKPAYQSLSTR